MRYLRPDYLDRFYCSGESCTVPCPAPADMTWTRTLGDLCETGVCLSCPQGTGLILLHPDPLTFHMDRDSVPAVPITGITQDQLDLMQEARKTVDIILQNRSLPFRSNMMLSIIYGFEFEPMISSGSRYAYDELDWGFTEQPYRQLSYALTSQGSWERKHKNLLGILGEMRDLFSQDALLGDHLSRTIAMLEPLTGEKFRALRENFDQYMSPREYLFENLMVYYNHRYFLAHAQEATVLPGIRLAAVSFAVIRAMAIRLYKDTGILTDNAFSALCRHWARCTEDLPGMLETLEEKFRTSPLYSQDELQCMLWQ